MLSARKKSVYVIYYSEYGHVLTLAREVCKGLERSGVEAKLFQVPETLPEEILLKMKAPPKAQVGIADSLFTVLYHIFC